MNLHTDIAALMRDLGVVVSSGGRSCKGMLDSFDEQILAGGGPANAVGRQIALTVRTGDLNVAPGASLFIDGMPHVVREKYALDDGMLTKLICAKGHA